MVKVKNSATSNFYRLALSRITFLFIKYTVCIIWKIYYAFISLFNIDLHAYTCFFKKLIKKYKKRVIPCIRAVCRLTLTGGQHAGGGG